MTEEETKQWVIRTAEEMIAMGVIAKKYGCVRPGSPREKALNEIERMYEELNPLSKFFFQKTVSQVSPTGKEPCFE